MTTASGGNNDRAVIQQAPALALVQTAGEHKTAVELYKQGKRTWYSFLVNPNSAIPFIWWWNIHSNYTKIDDSTGSQNGYWHSP